MSGDNKASLPSRKLEPLEVWGELSKAESDRDSVLAGSIVQEQQRKG